VTELKPARLSPDLIADIYSAAIGDDALGALANLVASLTATERVSLSIIDGGQVLEAAEIAPARAVCTSEDGAHRARTIRLAPGVVADIALNWPAGKPPDEQALLLLQRITPHIRRALQLRLRNRPRAIAPDRPLSALDALAFGAIICNKVGAVEYANAAAERLASREVGIVLRSGGSQVGAFLPEEGAKLAAVIREAAAGEAGGIRLSGRRQTALLLLASALPHEPNRALLTMDQEMAPPSFSATTLSALFRLSPAQASLAMALYEGKGFEEIAQERGVKVSTLRTHFAEVLTRTGAKGLRDLVRLLGSLPPLR